MAESIAEKSAAFDEADVRKHADWLYLKAASTLVLYTACVPFLCGVIGYVGDALRTHFEGTQDNTLLFTALLMGGIGGYAFGSEKAFFLKLQARTALCQIGMEENSSQH